MLTGSTMNSAPVVANSAPVEITPLRLEATADKQIVVMRIEGYSYIPNRFTVKQGVPVEWRIDASGAAGCGRFLLAPGLGIRKVLSNLSTTTISFVPERAGEFAFNCGMGMMTRGSKFIVLPNPAG